MSSNVDQRVMEVHAGGRCELSCGVCDCRSLPSEPSWVDATLAGGGRRLTLRGGIATSPHLSRWLKAAGAAGFEERAVRTNGLAFRTPAAAAALRRLGAEVAVVPLFSHAASTHDRIAGRAGAFAAQLDGIRALAAAGLAIELETPLLAPGAQDLPKLVALVRAVTPAFGAIHYTLPRFPLPAHLAAPPWDAGGARLAEAIRAADALGVRTVLRRVDAIPPCALSAHPAEFKAFQLPRRLKEGPVAGSAYLEPCSGCAARGACPGVADSYAHAHGARGIAPLKRLPDAITSTRRARVWTDSERDAARRARMLVLRPTVNCNQDCTFCSANETTGNVWTDKGVMLRQIARAGRRGIRWLSFSGGEPTLSPDLPRFVEAARRVGIEYVELITNGVLLDQPRRVDALAKAGLTNAFVSLHAHDEQLSRFLTQKVGDFARTVAAVSLLLDAGVAVTLNHVVNARNFRHLTRFVEFARERFGGRAHVSFAFVTPQYKALENLEVVPRLSEVMPHLRRALRRAQELEQPFVIGARQGIPPCFLREFQGWSDFHERSNEASAEDAPQKQRAAACDTCRYGDRCTGLWKPYVARYGTSELVPVPGPHFTAAELDALHPVAPQPPKFRFDQFPEAFRDRVAEAEVLGPLERADDPPARTSLSIFAPSRTRPLRVALLGTGARARRLAAALRAVPGLSLDAVASPHAPDGDLADFDHCPVFRTADDAFDAIRPEVALVAAATHAHAALATSALAAKIPILLEKPLARTIEEAEALVLLAESGAVPALPAHQVLFAPGLDALFAAPSSRVSLTRRVRAESPDAPRLWSRAAVRELLHHQLVLTGKACGGGVPEIASATWRGDAAPERLGLTLRYAAGVAELSLDFRAPADTLALACDDRSWRREGRAIAFGQGESVTHLEDADDVASLLRHFERVVLGLEAPRATLREGLEIMRGVQLALDALEAAGAPFDRPNAPKHVASRDLRQAV